MREPARTPPETKGETMTTDEINERVQAIKDIAHDDEVAHSAEDRLYIDVLQAIANGADNPRELAAAALATQGIEFARWYA
jgi:hypothetical protein